MAPGMVNLLSRSRPRSLNRPGPALLTPHSRNARRLQNWITTTRAASLPQVHAFTRGLDLDSQAATAALTLRYHNGRTKNMMASARCRS